MEKLLLFTNIYFVCGCLIIMIMPRDILYTKNEPIPLKNTLGMILLFPIFILFFAGLTLIATKTYLYNKKLY